MKATGIIRRIDDLGRVVIPKEIRKNLHIRENDPLELFVEENGVCFQKYNRYGEADWSKAKKILSALITPFALLDGYGDCVKSAGIKVQNEEDARSRKDVTIRHITSRGESLAYLVVSTECNESKMTQAETVLRCFLEEE